MKRQPILVVNDDAQVQKLLSRALRSARFEVVAAESAKAALDLLAARRFAVVVSDHHPPGVDGIELLRRIRRGDIDVPLVFVTGPPSGGGDGAVDSRPVLYAASQLDTEVFVAAVARGERLSRLARIRRTLDTTAGPPRSPADALELTARFDSACAKLWMAYQPIVSQRSGTVVGFEALLRSDEPSLATPPAFLAAGEQLGRLEDIGRRVRAAAAAAIAALPANVELFVNLHPFDLTDAELAMPDSPLSRVASRVVLEITERASLDRVRDAKARIAALRTLGFRVAIDDLGAGYAGLSWLATVEPDVVKIDMGLIRGIDADVKRQQVVYCLIGLCEKLDVRIVIEGVETQAERNTLVALGADYLQGYLFGRPERQIGRALAGHVGESGTHQTPSLGEGCDYEESDLPDRLAG